MKTIPLEFATWSGFSFSPVREGELTALVDLEMRYAIKQTEGFFHVLNWERGAGPFEVAAFTHEIDAVRELLIILGESGRSSNSRERLDVPAGIPTTEASMVLEKTEDGWAELSWEEDRERHSRLFRNSLVGHLHMRLFAQSVGFSISVLVDSLRSVNGEPVFRTVASA
ncbi:MULTISPECIES: hypothetical protein [Cryobacterium]|uniref:Uncharacterized protein n=1 Tax=Cryobacterium breve TaxID=1259258 RepID=A0ABY2IZ99_9MICO|nr:MULTISPECIES: hypothetical protein [Cryobacterium]TFC95931.1 hypothetical protein E3T20_04210 [Cryobacterium sp. TmT3-12]TFC97902.1 hypothetical protein E3O65_09250 [Cryobacterium breve]